MSEAVALLAKDQKWKTQWFTEKIANVSFFLLIWRMYKDDLFS